MEQMVAELVIRGMDDWVQACEIAEIAKFSGGAVTREERQELSIRLIEELVDRRLVQIGDVSEIGFEPWPLSPREAIERVREAWQNEASIDGEGTQSRLQGRNRNWFPEVEYVASNLDGPGA